MVVVVKKDAEKTGDEPEAATRDASSDVNDDE